MFDTCKVGSVDLRWIPKKDLIDLICFVSVTLLKRKDFVVSFLFVVVDVIIVITLLSVCVCVYVYVYAQALSLVCVFIW